MGSDMKQPLEDFIRDITGVLNLRMETTINELCYFIASEGKEAECKAYFVAMRKGQVMAKMNTTNVYYECGKSSYGDGFVVDTGKRNDDWHLVIHMGPSWVVRHIDQYGRLMGDTVVS